MRRLGLVALSTLALAACGGSGEQTAFLRGVSPDAAGTYFVFRGASGPIWATTHVFTSSDPRFVVTSSAHGSEDCSGTRVIRADQPDGPLRKYAGQTVSLTVYGDTNLARFFCHGCAGVHGILHRVGCAAASSRRQLTEVVRVASSPGPPAYVVISGPAAEVKFMAKFMAQLVPFPSQAVQRPQGERACTSGTSYGKLSISVYSASKSTAAHICYAMTGNR